jgi:hypothetical protein
MQLRAGKLSMLYENGNIRYISAGGNEIIRMVYSALRDREWLNVKPVITGERIERFSDSFRIEYNCKYISGDINFIARYIIEGKSDNTITFTLEGESLETFEKNRIGFCVLHPVEGCSGNKCFISHSDGSTESSGFPEMISPDQVFKDIKAMSWKTGKTECHLEFSGDIFETEDQRNWTDASYKTYSTPLSLPFPATVIKGEKISQKIEFRAKNIEQPSGSNDNSIELKVNRELRFPLPKLGLGRSTRGHSLEDNEVAIIKELKFDHYRCDLYLFKGDWKNIADQSVAEAAKLGYATEMVLFLDDEYEKQTESFINWMTEIAIVPAVVTILHKTISVTPEKLAGHVAPVIRKYNPGIKICIGTNANFAQLNEQKPSLENCDLVCYSVHPQEHASDNTTLLENLQAQSYTVISAKHFAEGKQIWVSPVNIQRRFNANIENFETQVSGDKIPPQVDSRMMSLFGACWTAGSIKYLGEAGVDGITYYETAGERGILQGNYKTLWPEAFRSAPGRIFPAFHVFRWLLADKSFSIIKSSSSNPVRADILALCKGNKIKVAIFNPWNENRIVNISGINGTLTGVCLETESFEVSCSDPSWIINAARSEYKNGQPLTLNPYSITFLEGTIQDN